MSRSLQDSNFIITPLTYRVLWACHAAVHSTRALLNSIVLHDLCEPAMLTALGLLLLQQRTADSEDWLAVQVSHALAFITMLRRERHSPPADNWFNQFSSLAAESISQATRIVSPAMSIND
eukprot:TRINITY_DN2367_c0_g1_i1.p1 TRINITY_DN2367_c0_g1~~TRINITY_DN2367_c0_g1_i1.p1  ORF type:complete len:128 (+),score=2.69 TRINITY_DN2367_c0_g1_i1:23-385(+)